MCKRSDLAQIMLVRRAIEQLISESAGTAATATFQEYLHVIDELKSEIEGAEIEVTVAIREYRL